MKKALFLTILLSQFILQAEAQDEGIQVSDNRVIYQRVFEGDIESGFDFLESIQGMQDVRESETGAFGTLMIYQSIAKRNLSEVGLSWANAMIFLQGGDVEAKVQLDSRDGRFRVTVSDFRGPLNNPTYTPSLFEVYILKKNGTIRSKQFEQTKLLYDHLFGMLFNPEQPVIESDDDW